MSGSKILWITAGLILAPSLAISQQTINVPADQPTIQAGINAAVNGDTVLVGPGTYQENIDFTGKAITVTSSGGAASTIIDASKSTAGVSFVSGETRFSVINGFTIKNAGASLWPNTTNSPFAGVNVGYTSACFDCITNPTITNNVITENYGYGILVSFGGALISGNTISYTSTQYNPAGDFGCDYDDGGGISVQGTPNDPTVSTTISGNTIEYNLSHCQGGGIGAYAAYPTITSNIIRYNESLGGGGGISGDAVMIQNLIYGNIAGTQGGGIDTGGVDVLVNNTVVGNTISLNPLIGDAYVNGSQIAFPGGLSGTIFSNNIVIAGDTYGAIACDPTRQYQSPAPLLVDHSDILNFSGPTFAGWCTVPPTTTNAMISADPQFLSSGSEPFRSRSGSPILDSGNPSVSDLPSQDIDGNTRKQNGAVDMGVYEGSSSGPTNPPPDFTVAMTPTSLIVLNGQSGTATLTITPTGGYIGAVTFTCSGQPTFVVCGFGPAGLLTGSLAIGGDNATVSTTLTVGNILPATSARSAGAGANALMGLAFACFVLLTVCRSAKPPDQYRRWYASAIWIPLFVALTSCGGGASSQPATPPPQTPPPNTATFKILATPTGNTADKGQSLSITITTSQ